MAKTDVYSWRISRARKAALEHVARETRTSLADLLDKATDEWIGARRVDATRDEAEQRRLQAAAAPFIGKIRGGDSGRATHAGQRLRAILKERRGR